MTLKLHDTLSGRKRVFEPLDPDHVRCYVCGPTVYNRIHVGNGRAAVVFDVLYRVLRAEYPRVTYARNFTDIDDKIMAAAEQEGVPIDTLTQRYIDAYNSDVAGLGTLPPDLTPRATGHLDDMIAMIERLVALGHAYEAEGHVLFAVDSDPAYGELSKRSLDDMIAGARVEVAPYKRHPADFVLWKPSTPEQPGWDSPWGRGRPGWHIECSAMIERHLGEVIDIHGGGQDLTFPHHENELAQSRCAHGHPQFVRYWLHNGMLTLAGEKMSKSLGNIVTVAELLQEYDGEVLRYALLSAHYRSSLVWSEELLEQSRRSLIRLHEALAEAGDPRDPTAPIPAALREALHDDLNTPRALAVLHELAGQLRTADSATERSALACSLRRGASELLGLLERDAASFNAADQALRARDNALTESAIEAKLTEREAARKARDFSRADAIRDELAAAGIEIKDSRDGPSWHYL